MSNRCRAKLKLVMPCGDCRGRCCGFVDQKGMDCGPAIGIAVDLSAKHAAGRGAKDGCAKCNEPHLALLTVLCHL
jgi:hypothetical protein